MPKPLLTKRIIRKSGNRFSDKMMRNEEAPIF